MVLLDELAIAAVLLMAIACVSCLSVEDRSRIRRMPRWAWLLVIVFVPVLGPIGWFTAGRPWPRLRPASPNAIARPPAPDDDPAFLDTLGTATGRPDSPPRSGHWDQEAAHDPDEQ